MRLAAVSLDSWKEDISKIPTPYTTLTEEQWLEACNHFGGCAYCGRDQIDSRAMFIQFKDGGRYCNWNIIPACEKCETMYKSTDNPFLRMDQKINNRRDSQARKYGLSLTKLARIVDYLHSKMEVK